MSKQFSIKMTRDAHEVVAKFKSAAEKNDVRFKGDDRNGRFSGKGIEGHYAISGDVLTITIEKKPMLVGWSLIETKVLDFFV